MALTGHSLYAQKLALRPEISAAFQRSKFAGSSIPEPYFSTPYNRGATMGVSLEYNYSKNDKLFLKAQNFIISNGFYNSTNEKPVLLHSILGEYSSVTSDQFFLAGLGLKKDVLLNSIEKAVYLTASIEFGIHKNQDTLGGSSGGYSPNTYYGLWKLTSSKRFFPMFSLGISHPFFNKKKREVIELSFMYHRAFSTVWEHTLYFYYAGPRYGSNDIQTAKFTSKVQTVLLTISKEIRIKNRKNK